MVSSVMAAKRVKPEYPKTVRYEDAKVRISKRKDGRYALLWRENGGWMRTTQKAEKPALEWAATKARKLAQGTGQQWIKSGEAEALETLRSIAGAEEGAMRRLLDDVRDARIWLEGKCDLTQAARYYAEQGPLNLAKQTIGSAAALFLGEYPQGSSTLKTYGSELKGFVADPKRAAIPLIDLGNELLYPWIHRTIQDKPGIKASKRTLKNRITTWITFLNRCRDWKFLPSGKTSAQLLKRPRIPDKGKEILSVDQGRALLLAVQKKDLRLETFLILAGWLGLRPSECQRATWACILWEKHYFHATVEVVLKTELERYIPIKPLILNRLRILYEQSGKKPTDKICLFRAREFLSVLAREEKILTVWPPDVLRHSFCSYRLEETKNIGLVAEEAGNSPKVIKKNYRKPVLPEEAAAWWALLAS